MHQSAKGNECKCKRFYQKYKASHTTDNENPKIHQIKKNNFTTGEIQLSNVHIMKYPISLLIKNC